MFSVHCDSHGGDVLLTARNVDGIDNDPYGMVVRWRCPCGQRGAFRTGRPRSRVAA